MASVLIEEFERMRMALDRDAFQTAAGDLTREYRHAVESRHPEGTHAYRRLAGPSRE